MNVDNSLDLLKGRFGAPKTTSGEDRGGRRCRRVFCFRPRFGRGRIGCGLAVALSEWIGQRGELGIGSEFERFGIQTETKAGGPRSIVEDVP